jgi:non-ribosomal peptide synthetase component F
MPTFEKIASECPDLRHIVYQGEISEDRRGALVECGVTTTEVGELQNLAGVPIEMSSSPEDLAAIIYTSGTTGKPKGVLLSHRNLIAMVASVCKVVEDRVSEQGKLQLGNTNLSEISTWDICLWLTSWNWFWKIQFLLLEPVLDSLLQKGSQTNP